MFSAIRQQAYGVNDSEVYDYDEASGELYEELSQFPMLTFFYDNATIGAGISHNQGYAGEFWPYTFYTYDAANDSYRAEYCRCSINLYPMSIITGKPSG